MNNGNVYNNPWTGQQPDDTEHGINCLNSDHGIMFPTNEFTESPEDYSAEVGGPALLPTEIDGFALLPAIDEHDVDAGNVHLNDLYPQVHTSLADDCWAYIVEPLLLALRPLRDLPHTLLIPIHYLLLTLYCIFTSMDGPFIRQLIPFILVEAAERYEPGAGFYINVVIGFMPHISERFRPTLALLSQLCDQCQVFLIFIAVLALSATERRLE